MHRQRLYDGHLVQKLEEIRDQLQQCGSGPAPADLLRWPMEIVGKEARRGDQGLKTKGSSVLVNEGMAKRNDKKTYTSEDISSKS